MQVCTSLQTDNHASTTPLSFLQAGRPSCCPTNSVKALKEKQQQKTTKKIKCTCIMYTDCCYYNVKKLQFYGHYIRQPALTYTPIKTLSLGTMFYCLHAHAHPYYREDAGVLFNSISCTISVSCLQCFDAVGWAAGRESGL